MTNNKSNLSWLFIRHLAHNPDNYRDAWLSCWYSDKKCYLPDCHTSFEPTYRPLRETNKQGEKSLANFICKSKSGRHLSTYHSKNGILQVQIIRV